MIHGIAGSSHDFTSAGFGVEDENGNLKGKALPF